MPTTGRIKKLIEDKGFGFIRPEDGGRDVFFHHSSVIDGKFGELADGQRVEFTLQDGEGQTGKGPRAQTVKPM